jgi:hypothetical protein
MRTPSSAASVIPLGRNVAEYSAIVGWWVVVLVLQNRGVLSPGALSVLVVLGCWVKTAFFGVENMRQLFHAARTNMAHHHFMMLMGVNMSQMILAFMFDFHLLHCLNPASFAGIGSGASQSAVLFDFFYLSTLNFSFFGYSDILPQTVAAKVVNLTEIVLAFATVIFMLSDFISLKDSLRGRSEPPTTE